MASSPIPPDAEARLQMLKDAVSEKKSEPQKKTAPSQTRKNE